MNRTITIICLLFLLPYSVFAQSNYKPASVVLLNGQQLTGSIDYKEWNRNPESFSFKDDKGRRTLSVHDVASFEINGLETFERFILTTKASGKPQSLSDIKTYISSYFTDTIFIRLITSGNFLNLYVYENNVCTRFFVRDNNRHETSELIYSEYYPYDNMSRIDYNNKYKGQLSLLAHDPAAHNQNKAMQLLERTAYASDALTRVVNLLNAEDEKKTNSKFNLKPFAGLFFQRSQASYSGQTPLADAPQKSSYRPGINAGLDFYTNGEIRKYIVRLEASMGMGSFETQRNVAVSTKEYHSYYHTFNFLKLGIAPQFLMNIYNKEQFKFNVGVGFSFDYSTFSNDDYHIVHVFYGTPNEYNSPFAYRHFSLSVPFRAGMVLYKKIDIFGKYNLPLTNNSDYLSYSLTIRSMQIGVNYLF